MAIINPTLPTLGDLNATEDGDVRNALLTIVNAINGSLDANNLADGAVTSQKILDGTIALADLAAATQNAFLKLLVAADKKVSFGTYTASFAGTSLFGDNPPIAHGLGVVPDRVLITQRASTGDSVAGIGWAKTKDTTNFTPRSVAVAASIGPNYDVTFDWVAIG
jgi:hypothetical protein